MASTARALAATAVMVTVVAGAACTRSARPAVESWQTVTTAPAWTLAGYTPASEVETTEAGFVLYALDQQKRLVAIGVDAASGKQRWERPANQSWIPGGVGLHVAVHERLAVFMTASPQDATKGWVRVTAVDAITGSARWTDPTVYAVTSQPWFCADKRSICLIGHRSGQAWRVVLDPADGRQISTTPAPGSREVAEELFAVDAKPELARVGPDGGQVWRRPIAEIFASPDVSPDNGWHILRRDGRYVGWLGGRSEQRTQVLGNHVMAGFDEATGAPLWSVRGARSCSGIALTLDNPVRCTSSTGRVTYPENEDPRLEGDITIEGFDPATGQAHWSWPAGAVPGLAFDHNSVRRFDDTWYVVTTTSETVVLNVTTGSRRPATPAPPMWCDDSGEVVPAVPISGRSSNGFRVEHFWPCQLDGTEVGSPRTVPSFAGARSGDVFAWVAKDSLHAVTVGRPSA